MASSASTPTPPADRAIRLWVRLAGEDDPKACTGRRLLRRGLARDWSRTAPGRGPIVLDPHAPVPLSSADRPRAQASGVAVIDCSWNRLGSRGRFPAETDVGRAPRRRLPFLIAGNPQHYGRLGELNTAEALGAALAVLGEAERAKALLLEFPGGPGFLALNRELILRYAACTTPEEIRRAESEFF